jgi:hypothetical protein
MQLVAVQSANDFPVLKLYVISAEKINIYDSPGGFPT